jgi:hypothetical protein
MEAFKQTLDNDYIFKHFIIATPRPDVDQIVGRILRVEKAKRTTDPLIIDIVDPAFRRQFQERLSLYNKRNYKVEKMKMS